MTPQNSALDLKQPQDLGKESSKKVQTINWLSESLTELK